MTIEVRTQAELDKALESDSAELIACVGDGWFSAWGSSHVEARDSSHVVARDSSHVEAWGSSHVEAWGSSHVEARDSSHVEAWDSSHVVAWGSSHVEAWGSSHVVARDSSHVVAWDSSHVVAWDSSHVEARDSSHVVAWDSSHVEAWDSSHVEARGSSHVVASPYVAITRQSQHAKVAGGVVITPPRIDSAQVWLEYHGVPIKDGVVILYKAVDANWHAGHTFPDGAWPDYSPGSRPSAPDFDPAPRDCGCGLHGCPSPSCALVFKRDATRFVAIPVAISDLGAPDPDGDTSKIRFRCATEAIYEVDIDGRPVT